MPKLCSACQLKPAAVMRYDKTILCRECFIRIFEDEVHKTITDHKIFQRGQKVAIGASGGKDSAVLAKVLQVLNERHDYGLELYLLSIDEGISGYRDHSLEEVKFHSETYGLHLKILSYKDLYNWSMDEIVEAAGRKSNCTFCGVFRRQALDRGAWQLGVDIVATGHNADDVAETVIMNMTRGDIGRLSRCTAITTADDPSGIPRVKPLKYQYEAEIVKYARHNKVRYFSTECTYAPGAHRGNIREFLRAATKIRPHIVLDTIKSGEALAVKEGVKLPIKGTCKKCDYISSQEYCKACMMLEGLNTGRPLLGIGKAKVRKGPRVQRKKKNESNGDCGENECKTGCKNQKTSESRAEDVPIKASGDSCEEKNSWIDNKSEDKESEGCGKVLDEFSNLAINAEASDLF